jgi:hypothetical protein
MKVLELPARGLVEVQLKEDPTLELKAGKLAPIQGLDGIAARLPDDDVCLEARSGGVLRVQGFQGLAVKLPEGVRFQAPKGEGVLLNEEAMNLPAGTKVIWPHSDPDSPPKYSDVVAGDDSLLALWPPARTQGDELVLVLQAAGRFRFPASS